MCPHGRGQELGAQMISIITAIYNQGEVNRLYYESLKAYTVNPFELIIIDNGSTDGSAEFFESVGAKVIRNGANYSYPYCQNRGIGVAQYDWLAFLNNDIVVSPQWDKRVMESMQVNGLEVATLCGIENAEDRTATRALKRRWRVLRNLLTLFGVHRVSLRLSHLLMYGNWVRHCERRYSRFRHKIKEGFVGCAIMMQRSALDKVGLWDERVQSADYDLYLRTKDRSIRHGDIRPVHICLDVFVHHYIRVTLRARPPQFADAYRLINLQDKWPKEYLVFLESIDN